MGRNPATIFSFSTPTKSGASCPEMTTGEYGIEYFKYKVDTDASDTQYIVFTVNAGLRNDELSHGDNAVFDAYKGEILLASAASATRDPWAHLAREGSTMKLL
jgi:hypothetical protein